MDARTTFPRVTGGIVLDSFSLGSFFTGLIAVLPAGLLLLVLATGTPSSRGAAAVFVTWGLTVLVLVSRYAQVALAGDFDGGLFSDAAGPWSGTLLAAARLLVLWALWVVPVVAWALSGPDAAAPAALGGTGPLPVPVPHVPFLLLLWSGIGAVLSFAFVAVAAAAPGFAGLFSPGLWGTLFGGRLGELFLAMAGTFGAPVAVLAVVFPALGALATANPNVALTTSIPFGLYVVGMGLSLQGRLSGAFAASSLAAETDVEAPAPAPAAPAPAPAAPAHAAPASAPVEASAAVAPSSPVPAVGDPRSLYAVWQARAAAGDTEGAIAAARETIPAGLAKGEAKLAAEVYRRHLDRLSDLDLDRAALDALADQLMRDGDVAAAAWTWSQALDAEPSDAKAFKGLLKVAEHFSEKAKQPLESIRVYRYLLDRAPASPFAEHARDLLAGAERKAAREQAPKG